MIDRRRFVASGCNRRQSRRQWHALGRSPRVAAPPSLPGPASTAPRYPAHRRRPRSGPVLREGSSRAANGQGFMIDFRQESRRHTLARQARQSTKPPGAMRYSISKPTRSICSSALIRRPQRAQGGRLFRSACSITHLFCSASNDFTATTWDSLNKPEFKVAVDQGSARTTQMITRTCPNATIIRLESAPTATLALQSGTRRRSGAGHYPGAAGAQEESERSVTSWCPRRSSRPPPTSAFARKTTRPGRPTSTSGSPRSRANGKVKDVVMANLERPGGRQHPTTFQRASASEAARRVPLGLRGAPRVSAPVCGWALIDTHAATRVVCVLLGLPDRYPRCFCEPVTESQWLRGARHASYVEVFRCTPAAGPADLVLLRAYRSSRASR